MWVYFNEPISTTHHGTITQYECHRIVRDGNKIQLIYDNMEPFTIEFKRIAWISCDAHTSEDLK